VEQALESARSGAGVTLLVEGPPGIGKTSLLAAARRQAGAHGMAVLDARATPLERDFPMGVVRQCLEPALHATRDRDTLLAGAAGLAASVVLGVPATDAEPLAGVLHGLYWLTANLAERRPLLLAVDDVQEADEPSLRFLAYLALRIESLPVALLVCARTEEATAAPEALTAIRTHPATQLLAPRPLSVEGVDALLHAAAGGPVEREFAQACHDATGGNPLLLGELVRALRSDGVPFTVAGAARVTEVTPPTVARSVQATLDSLGSPARALARAVAVLGEDAALELAARLAGVSVAEAAGLAAELARSGILDDATPLRFRHPILASAVRASHFASERGAMHTRAAALLRARGAGPERLALQLLHAPPAGDAGVVAELVAAAAGARRRGAPRTAASLLARALDEPPKEDERPGLLLDLGLAQYVSGETAAGATRLQEAARCEGDVVVRSRALLALTQASPYDQRTQAQLSPLVAEVLPELERRDPDLALRLQTLSALMGRPGPELDAAVARCRALAGATPGEALALAYALMPLIRAGADAREIADAAERAAPQAHVLLEEGATAIVVVGIVLALRWTDRLDSAQRLLDRVIASARRRGSTADYAIALSHRAWVNRRAGRLRDAEADARGALAAGVDRGSLYTGPPGVIPLIGCLVDAGREDEAADELTAAGGDGELPEDPTMTPLLLERMRLRAAQGQYHLAAADWEDAARRAQRLFGINPAWIEDLTVAAAVRQALGEHAAAAELATQALSLARQWHTPGGIGQALHAAARLQDGAQREATLREAIAHLSDSPARLELARSLVTLGVVLRRENRRIDSREPLRDGYELARECGARGLAETARAELRASGIRVRRHELTGLEALTPSERRIAEMAAAGATNAEIAQALFLTVKTVEMHLTGAYRKLELRGRRDLPAALGGAAA
jgi:DNA-binding CsgD family transcriptional regulator